ncbi:MAG: hypothetical protein ACLR2G_13230 [Phascolarctobacterium faecium]
MASGIFSVSAMTVLSDCLGESRVRLAVIPESAEAIARHEGWPIPYGRRKTTAAVVWGRKISLADNT